jgi:hypothetical protein
LRSIPPKHPLVRAFTAGCGAVLLAAGVGAAALRSPSAADTGVEWGRAPAVASAVPAPRAEVHDLPFGELFERPVGPRGLQATAKLLALDGQRVRLSGYMARSERPVRGMFILAPLPVDLGGEDEALADDLPPAAVFAVWDSGAPGAAASVPHLRGLVHVSGVLRLGPREEADGRVSQLRLELEPVHARELARLASEPSGVPSAAAGVQRRN